MWRLEKGGGWEIPSNRGGNVLFHSTLYVDHESPVTLNLQELSVKTSVTPASYPAPLPTPRETGRSSGWGSRSRLSNAATPLGPAASPPGALTCALLLLSAHALEPLEHAAQVGDSILEGDLLVLTGFRVLQQLPYVHLGFFLLLLHLPNRGEPRSSLVAALTLRDHEGRGIILLFQFSVKKLCLKPEYLKPRSQVLLAGIEVLGKLAGSRRSNVCPYSNTFRFPS